MAEQFIICRTSDGESWRDAAARYARPHGLAREVLEIFDAEKAAKPDKDEAVIAWDACYEWDVLPLTK